MIVCTNKKELGLPTNLLFLKPVVILKTNSVFPGQKEFALAHHSTTLTTIYVEFYEATEIKLPVAVELAALKVKFCPVSAN